MPTSGSILGNPVLRKEDPGILEGTTQYYDDLAIPGLLHTALVRSTVAHENIVSIDASDAQDMPGVVGVYTAGDFDLPTVHGFIMLPPTMSRRSVDFPMPFGPVTAILSPRFTLIEMPS